MTVETLTTESGPFAAGGTVYYFTFQALSADDVKSYVGGVLGAPVVTLNADQVASPGGYVTFASAAGGEVTIRRETTLDQQTEYVVGSAFPAAAHEAALDRVVMQVQEAMRDAADGDAVVQASVTAEAALRSAGDSAEAAARAAADALLVASGVSPANVGIAPVAATGSTGQLRTVADRFGDEAHVLSFVGADPTGAADSSAAITAAIAAAGEGGTVVFPAGEFLLGSPVTPLKGQRWRGAGASIYVDGTVLKVAAVNGKAIYVPALTVGEKETIGIHLTGFCIDGPASPGDGSIGIHLEADAAGGGGSINNICLEHIVFNALDIGLLAEDVVPVNSGQISNISLRDCHFYGVGDCLKTNTQNASFWNVRNCNFQVSGSFLRVLRGGQFVLESCTGYGFQAGAALLKIEGPIGNVLLNQCQSEAIDYTALVTYGSNAPITFLNCYIDAPISCSGTQRWTFIGCQIGYDITDSSGGSFLIFVGNQLSATADLVIADGSQVIEIGNAKTGGGSISSSIGYYRTGAAAAYANVTNEFAGSASVTSQSIAAGATLGVDVPLTGFQGALKAVWMVGFSENVPDGLVATARHYGNGYGRVIIHNTTGGPVTMPACSAYVLARVFA